MASCNSCGATITWARTLTGSRMPMERAGDGTWIIVNGVALYRSPLFNRPDKQARYKSHFATCPQAQQWRGKKRADG